MRVEGVSPSDIYQELLQLTLTEGMPAWSVERLSHIAQLRSYPAGRVLFAEAEHHHSIYIICRGLVTLEMRIPNHGVQKILTVGCGELLAWSALLADGVMTTSAVVTEETRAIEFLAEDLRSLCEQDFELGYHVMRQVAVALSRRLLATRLQLLDLFRNCS